MNINLELYKIFYYVAKRGNITKAANDLHISQPAVSQNIKNLETMLGGILFHRTKKGVLLTVEGKVLFDYISKAYTLIQKGETRFSDIINMKEGEIRIGASDTICKHFLMPYITGFSSQYPNIKIHVTNKTSYESIDLLKGGLVDICFVNLPIQDDDLDIIKYTEIHDIAVCGNSLYQKTKSISNLEGIQDFPLCMLGKESNTRKYIDKYALSQDIILTPEFELNSSDLLIEFAKNNIGISFVVKEHVSHHLAEKDLFEIKLKPPIESRSIGLVKVKGIVPSTSSMRFLEYINDVNTFNP